MYVSPINEIVRLQQNLKAAGQQKRGRHPVFNANMFYPRKLENELNDLLRAELERIFLENMAVALNGSGLRDDVAEMNAAPVVLSSGFLEKSKNFAERVNANAGDTYQKQVELIIGRPYYPPTAQREILEAWHDEFQALCISAGQDGKKKIAMTVAVAKEKGWNKKQTEEAIRALLPAETKHRAELIARTETGKLNSRCVRETYAQTGVKYYKWLTTIDGRERETHAAMNGQICDVSDPDVIYEENPNNPLRPIKKNKTGEMVHLHPGQDFQCRCTMVMWEPEIDGKYEVTEDHEREEAERLEMEEKTRQEEAERKAREREAEEEKKRQEAEEKYRKEMEEKAKAEAERKIAEAKAKAEAKVAKAEAKAKAANGVNEKILKTFEKETKAEYKEYKAAEKAFMPVAKTYYGKRAGKYPATFLANEAIKDFPESSKMYKAAQDFNLARYKWEMAVMKADTVYRANGHISYTIAEYLKGTEKEYREAAAKIWENGDPRLKALYLKIKNAEVLTPKAKQGRFTPVDFSITLGKECRLMNQRGLSATLWHELGHNVHRTIGTPLYARLTELEAAAKKDLGDFFKRVKEIEIEAREICRKNGLYGNNYAELKAGEIIRKEGLLDDLFEAGNNMGAPKAVYSIFTDIVEGFSNGDVMMYSKGFFGHGYGYWQKDATKKVEEFWAEMFEAYMRPEIKEALKKRLPNMMKIFEDELNKVSKI